MDSYAKSKRLEMNLSATDGQLDHRLEAMALRSELDEIIHLYRKLKKSEISTELFLQFMENNFGFEDEK
jgi:hypothetical protein